MAIGIVATGVLLIHDNDIDNNRIIGWIISSVGVYLSFMAKPQTSIALILLVIMWSIISSKFSWKGLISAAIVSFTLLLITTFWIDGSPIAFIERFLEAIKRESLADQHELITPFIFSISTILNILTIRLILTALLICIYALIIDKIRDKYSNRLAFYLIFAAIPGYFIYLIIYPSYKFYSYYGTFIILAPTTGLIITELFQKKYKSIVNNKHFGILCILFGMFAISYGLGSSNDISIMLALSSFYILLGILFLFAKLCPIESFQSRLTIIASFTFIISIAINHMSFAFPYRQPRPIWANNVKINIQEGSGELILPQFIAKYIDDLHKVAKITNLIPDTPMIDLSGRLPGTLYVLNSFIPKSSWIISGINNRNKYASYIFSTIPCEDITKSWLLIDDDVYEIPFDPMILKESGIDANTDYELVAVIKNPKYHTDNTVTYSNHYILKPIKNHDDAISSCLKARNLSHPEK
jgi:MFS family permease